MRKQARIPVRGGMRILSSTQQIFRLVRGELLEDSGNG
jgi:hypothetical protein